MTGLASINDRDELKALWQSCFHEEQPFLDWFFDARFLPEYCVQKSVDGQIVCAMHGLPVRAHIRDALLPVVLASGVATREDARGQGHMREVFTQFMRIMHGRGAAAVLHHPVDAAVYMFLQQYPCADARFVTRSGRSLAQSMPDTARVCDMREVSRELYRCYSAFAARYSCAIARTYAEHAQKLDDYLAGAGSCVAVYDGFDIAGYCVYFDEGDTLYGDECAARSDAAYDTLFAAMSALVGGKRLKLRLAPDVRLTNAAVKSAIQPHSLIGAVNVTTLLSASGCRAQTPIAVTDSVIPENNGVFLPDGSRTDARPHLSMDAGRLAQWAAGYRSMEEIVAAGDASLLYEGADASMDSVGKRSCYLVEEY